MPDGVTRPLGVRGHGSEPAAAECVLPPGSRLILYSDGMDARVSLDDEVWNITDMSNEDLFGIADRTEALMLEGAPFG